MPDYSNYRLMPLTARSRLDPRDYRFSLAQAVDVMAEIAAGTLPANVDLHALGTMPDPWDQGSEGSCTGHMEAEAMVHSYMRAKVTLPERLSPRYIYWRERVIENDTGQDAGAEPRDGFDQLVKVGVCVESQCAYVPGDFASPPSSAADVDAATHRAERYEALATWQDIVLALGQDNRFVGLALPWFNEWFNPPGGVLPQVDPKETPAGGHAPGFCGYRTQNGRVQFRLHNSWGRLWGDGTGHAWMDGPTADNYLWERWVVYGAVEVNPAPFTPDPITLSWLTWRGQANTYVADRYQAGDLVSARAEESVIAHYEPAINALLMGLRTTRKLPVPPPAVPQ